MPLLHPRSSLPHCPALCLWRLTLVDPSTQAPLPSGFLLGLAKAEPQEHRKAGRSGRVCFPHRARSLLSRAVWQWLVPSGGSPTLALPSPGSGDSSAWFHSHRLHPSPSQLSPRQPEKHMIKSSSSIVTTIQEEGLETLLPLRTLSVKMEAGSKRSMNGDQGPLNQAELGQS